MLLSINNSDGSYKVTKLHPSFFSLGQKNEKTPAEKARDIMFDNSGVSLVLFKDPTSNVPDYQWFERKPYVVEDQSLTLSGWAAKKAFKKALKADPQKVREERMSLIDYITLTPLPITNINKREITFKL